jgi:hypothetical protein
MQEKNKVYALSQGFMNKLYEEWTDLSNNESISDFLSLIKNKYSVANSEYFVKGDTGIYFDNAIIDRLNTEKQNQRKDFEYDFDSSRLLYYGDNKGPGLYSVDENGNHSPLKYLSATDPRIWNYLSLFVLNEYTIKRWGDSKDSKRLFLSRLSNERISRHSISRLYWSADLCYDSDRVNKTELLEALWHNEDFMTQITERSTADNKQQLQWFLEFCKKPNNIKKIFNTESSEGYKVYRKLIKLSLADQDIFNIGSMEKNQFLELLQDNLEAC